MSYSLLNIFASLPRTQRGTSIVLGSDPKGKNFLYVNGNSVFIRNIENPFECDVYTEHSLPVYCAKYSPSGFYIASADQSGKIRIWDTVNKEHLLKNEFQPLSGTIKDLQWSSDNARIIVGGEGREKFGHVFNADTGTSVGEIMGTSKSINSVDFKPTRPFRAVVASEDASVCYFEGPPFKWKKAYSDHERFVNVVRYSPNGDRFVSGGADGKLILYDGKTGDKLNELGKPAHGGSIYSVSWDETSKRLLSASGDKTAKLWDIDSGAVLKEFHFGNSIDDQQVGSLWQGKYALTVSLSGSINYLNINTDNNEQILKTLKGHNKSISTLAVGESNGHQMVFSASHEGLIIGWDAQTGTMDNIKGGSMHTNIVQQMCHRGNTLVSCSYDDTLKFIDTNHLEYVDDLKLDSQPQGIALGHNEVVIVACTNRIVLIKNRQKVTSLNIAFEATCVSMKNSQDLIAVGGKDSKVHLFSVNLTANTITEIKTLDERDAITAIAYSHDDQYLAVADNNKNVKCYSLALNYENITRDKWQHHAAKITSIAWSPNSKQLATTSVDTHVMVYTPENVSNYIQIKSKLIRRQTK
jgi:WD repeat-containing protein 1 (actin-interacting protein 1)